MFVTNEKNAFTMKWPSLTAKNDKNMRLGTKNRLQVSMGFFNNSFSTLGVKSEFKKMFQKNTTYTGMTPFSEFLYLGWFYIK